MVAEAQEDMHMAGEFVRHLYPGLRETFPEIPSINFIEEFLRVGGLLHDVGHGPYGHFFDDHFLSQYGLTHEILGQKIITDKLGHLIKQAFSRRENILTRSR